MLFDTVTIVGVGLIGGSVGHAIRVRRVAKTVLGYDVNPEFARIAYEVDAIERIETDLSKAVSQSQLIVVATPVDRIVEDVLTAASHCIADTLITDTGSTKVGIVEGIESHSLPPGVQFVGGHPIAGSEKSGPVTASFHLLQDRLAVVTPTAHSREEGVEKIEQFWQRLGMRTIRLTAAEHDRNLAESSHLPHVAAAALAGILSPEVAPFTGTGFRDTTRIAGGNPELWTPIFFQNKEAVIDQIDRLIERLAELQNSLANDEVEQFKQLLYEGKRRRDALGS